MTVKEVSQSLGVSVDTVTNCINRILPNKMKKGKTTYLNEKECSLISMELKNNNTVLDRLTSEVSSEVKATTTELEILANYKKANDDFVKLMELKTEQLQSQVEEMKPKALYYDKVVDASALTNFRNTAKQLGIKEREFISFLFKKGYIYRDKKGKILPYGKHDELFQVKEFDNGGFISFQTFITEKGKAEIFKKLNG